MKKNIVYEKSFNLSVQLCICAREIKEKFHEYDLTSQLVKSSTSVHANLSESLFGSSSKDFIARLRISLREAEESRYWLEMFQRLKYIDNDTFETYHSEMTEICRILTAIVKTTSNRIAVATFSSLLVIIALNILLQVGIR